MTKKKKYLIGLSTSFAIITAAVTGGTTHLLQQHSVNNNSETLKSSSTSLSTNPGNNSLYTGALKYNDKIYGNADAAVSDFLTSHQVEQAPYIGDISSSIANADFHTVNVSNNSKLKPYDVTKLSKAYAVNRNSNLVQDFRQAVNQEFPEYTMLSRYDDYSGKSLLDLPKSYGEAKENIKANLSNKSKIAYYQVKSAYEGKEIKINPLNNKDIDKLKDIAVNDINQGRIDSDFKKEKYSKFTNNQIISQDRIKAAITQKLINNKDMIIDLSDFNIDGNITANKTEELYEDYFDFNWAVQHKSYTVFADHYVPPISKSIFNKTIPISANDFETLKNLGLNNFKLSFKVKNIKTKKDCSITKNLDEISRETTVWTNEIKWKDSYLDNKKINDETLIFGNDNLSNLLWHDTTKKGIPYNSNWKRYKVINQDDDFLNLQLKLEFNDQWLKFEFDYIAKNNGDTSEFDYKSHLAEKMNQIVISDIQLDVSPSDYDVITYKNVPLFKVKKVPTNSDNSSQNNDLKSGNLKNISNKVHFEKKLDNWIPVIDDNFSLLNVNDKLGTNKKDESKTTNKDFLDYSNRYNEMFSGSQGNGKGNLDTKLPDNLRNENDNAYSVNNGIFAAFYNYNYNLEKYKNGSQLFKNQLDKIDKDKFMEEYVVLFDGNGLNKNFNIATSNNNKKEDEVYRTLMQNMFYGEYYGKLNDFNESFSTDGKDDKGLKLFYRSLNEGRTLYNNFDYYEPSQINFYVTSDNKVFLYRQDNLDDKSNFTVMPGMYDSQQLLKENAFRTYMPEVSKDYVFYNAGTLSQPDWKLLSNSINLLYHIKINGRDDYFESYSYLYDYVKKYILQNSIKLGE